MTIHDVAGNVKRSGKASGSYTNDKKTGKIDLVEVLRIQKQVRNTQIFAEVSGNHGKEDDPAKDKNLIALEIIEQKLNRKREKEGD
ncbi:hypothetical protein QQ054_18305 [Oscillatoria amoena NRMC-F 0135]|nr:hypothetical protein [Oscillatoria amoena NRMC-F 0135]